MHTPNIVGSSHTEPLMIFITGQIKESINQIFNGYTRGKQKDYLVLVTATVTVT